MEESLKEEYIEVIEGMLFLCGDDGLTSKEIAKILMIEKKTSEALLEALIDRYQHHETGLQIVNFGGHYKLSTKAKHKRYYERMVEQNEATLSNAALETLAIIAYRQPVTRTQIEEIRGVGCDNMIRRLLAKALIKEVGREETPGMPILYGTTDEFMDAFHLASLEELPELKDLVTIEETDDIYQAKYTESEEVS